MLRETVPQKSRKYKTLEIEYPVVAINCLFVYVLWRLRHYFLERKFNDMKEQNKTKQTRQILHCV